MTIFEATMIAEGQDESGASVTIKAGSKIIAKQGTVADIFAVGTVGIVVELFNPSISGSNNLVRWDNGEGILMGFSLDDVEGWV